MNKTQLIYLVFSAVIIISLVFDLGLMSKKDQESNYKAGIVSNLFLGRPCIGILCFFMDRRRPETGAGIFECLSYGVEPEH